MIVIDIGHSRTGDKGAFNSELGLYEWDWNKRVADAISGMCWHKTKIIERTDGITKLVRDINAQKPTFCVSLHCNSFSNPKSSGTEVLYWHKSEKSKAAASIMQKRLVTALMLPDRGIKPVTAQDRGGWQLKEVSSPIILLEPFFLSNREDVDKVKKNWTLYMDAMLQGIDQIVKEVL